MTDQELNRRVAEKLGIEWHKEGETNPFRCICGRRFNWVIDVENHCKAFNPDFCSNAKVLLETIQEKQVKFYKTFMSKVGGFGYDNEKREACYFMYEKYILNPRLLCEEYLKWEER